MSAVFGYDFEPNRLRGMTTPTLLLVGELSSETAQREAELLHESFPDSRIAILRGQEHLAHRMAPDRFAETVLGFLAEPG